MPFGQVLHLNALSFSLCLYRLHSEKSNQTKILFFERKIFKPPKPYILISIIVYVGPIFATGIKKIPVTFIFIFSFKVQIYSPPGAFPRFYHCFRVGCRVRSCGQVLWTKLCHGHPCVVLLPSHSASLPPCYPFAAGTPPHVFGIRDGKLRKHVDIVAITCKWICGDLFGKLRA